MNIAVKTKTHKAIVAIAESQNIKHLRDFESGILELSITRFQYHRSKYRELSFHSYDSDTNHFEMIDREDRTLKTVTLDKNDDVYCLTDKSKTCKHCFYVMTGPWLAIMLKRDPEILGFSLRRPEPMG